MICWPWNATWLRNRPIADYAERPRPATGAAAAHLDRPRCAWRAAAPDEIDRQWKTLAYDLTQRERFARFAPETYDVHALILASDHDPLDILLRRTQALLSGSNVSAAWPPLHTTAQP